MSETTTRPPAAPDFHASDVDRREWRLAMRAWWLDKADIALTAARAAADQGDDLTAMLELSNARTSVTMSRVYRDDA